MTHFISFNSWRQPCTLSNLRITIDTTDAVVSFEWPGSQDLPKIYHYGKACWLVKEMWWLIQLIVGYRISIHQWHVWRVNIMRKSFNTERCTREIYLNGLLHISYDTRSIWTDLGVTLSGRWCIIWTLVPISTHQIMQFAYLKSLNYATKNCIPIPYVHPNRHIRCFAAIRRNLRMGLILNFCMLRHTVSFSEKRYIAGLLCFSKPYRVARMALLVLAYHIIAPYQIKLSTKWYKWGNAEGLI